jgi:hypothetical protein
LAFDPFFFAGDFNGILRPLGLAGERMGADSPGAGSPEAEAADCPGAGSPEAEAFVLLVGVARSCRSSSPDRFSPDKWAARLE